MKKHYTILFMILVAMIANNLFGNSSTGKEKSITANFYTDITLLTKGSSINYVDLSTGSPVSWQWTFEGGQPATYSGKIPPPVKYNISGQFDVVLTVQDASGNTSIETKSDYISVVDAPPGWSVQASASTHLISVPASISLTGFPFGYGDFLGVFYLDENNQEKCGGFTIWDATNNRALIAFGDDATTTIKEGFADGELLSWKVYLSQYADGANASVVYNPAMPVSDGNFHTNGMSGITALDVSYTIPMVVEASASPAQLCAGDPVQLTATATGGTMTYSFSWSASPEGFSSNLQNPVAFPDENTVYTLFVDDGENTATASAAVVVTSQPVADAGADDTIVAGAPFTLSGSNASDAGALQWTTSGEGTFSNSTLLHPQYAPAIADIIAGQVELCLTAQPLSPCTLSDTDCMQLFIEPSVVAFAGTDHTICADQSIVLVTATAENFRELMWSTTGSGTFDKYNLLHPEYFPSAEDAALGSVDLCLTATALPPEVSSVTDCMTLSFQQLPEVDAGSDLFVCQGNDIQLSEAAATNAGNLLWTTSGAGTFSNQNALNPIYYPHLFDYQAQCITLTLMVSAIEPCTTGAQDALEVCFKLPPQPDAGADQTICENSQAELQGSVQNGCGNIWSSRGDGTFDDVNNLQAIYTPGSADIAQGSVVIILTGQPCEPCTTAYSDSLTLTLQQLAIVSAGPDAGICYDVNFETNEATADNYDQLQWFSTDGNGFFENENQLHATYYPSPDDYISGCVTLTVAVSSIDPCYAVAEDYLELCFQQPPAVDVGGDATICEDQSFAILQAEAENYAQLQWSGGAGIFDDPTKLDAIYTPAAAEVGTQVELCLTASPVDPCSVAATDCFSLFVQPSPEAFAGADVTFCEGVIVELDEAVASNYTQVMWISITGMGEFSNFFDLNTSYAPSPFDYQAGCITLALMAQPVSPCAFSAIDTLEVCFQKPATANAGQDQTICETDNHHLISAGASLFSSVTWTTSGDGAFDNPQLLHPVYAPGSNDITAKSVHLILAVQGIAPCSNIAVDSMKLTIQPMPEVFAGDDAIVVAGEAYANSDAIVAFADSFFWQTTGDGTFDDPNLLHMQYVHGSNDQIAGSVTLTLIAQPTEPCQTAHTNSLLLTIASPPTVSAPEDFVICSDVPVLLAGADATNFSALLWQTTGDGTFDDPTILQPFYTPGENDANTGTVELCLTVQPLLPLFLPATDCIDITIQKAPTAFAGNDQNICESENIVLDEAVANNYSAVVWSGGAGSFDNVNIINPTYTPAASEAGTTVTLCLSAMAIDPCTTAANDCIDITIQKAPTAFAGTDQNICESENIELSEAEANNYSTILWSGGTGSFDNPNAVNPTYTPAASEAGTTVTLCLSAMATDPCTTATTDCIDITIQKTPTAFAGTDQNICESENIVLDEAEANNYSAVVWSGGAGSYDNPNAVNPTYTPAASEAGTTVTLCLSAMAIDPCTTATTDCIDITIQKTPTAFAGTDQNICESENIVLDEAEANNYSAVVWSGGAGSFDNPNAVNPTYTPTASEAGTTVTLCLSAMAIDPCTTAANDCIDITIQKAPTAFAGTDQNICESEIIVLNEAAANNYSTILWSGGAGSFDNVNIINPTYTPAASEAGTTVTLCLSAMATDPCATATTSCIDITIQKVPTAFAGTDQNICESENIELSEAVANNYSAVVWSGGAGSFDNVNIINPTYTPAASEAGTTVTLCLSAMAIDPCTTATTDCIDITIQKTPTAFAGTDQNICESENIELSEAVANNYSAVVWSGGTGSYDNPNALNPTYTPAASEAGTTVTLCLSAMAIDPCTTATTDCIDITIQKTPTAFAGTDQNICESEIIVLNEAAANNYSTILWSGGAGSYDNPNAVNPTYTPAASEAGTTVTLCLSAMAIDPCTTATTDCIDITIQKAPTAFAGTDQNICESENIELSEAVANNYSAVVWSGGAGSFDNVNIINPTYTPAASEAGTTVTLCLSAMAIDPCTTATTDCIDITIQKAPTAFAGNDQNICESENIVLDEAVANNYSAVVWSGGAGSYDNPNILNPTYTPAASEAGTTVTLCLSAMAIDPCTTATTDCIDITIQKAPTAFAGNDQNICESENIVLDEAEANNYSAVVWSGGAGSYDNPNAVNPTYTPAACEAGTTVTLCLSAMAIDPCTTAANDCIDITIQKAPTAFAGTDQNICESENIVLDEAEANNYSAVVWSGGAGSYDNPNAVNPTYTPAASEAGTTVTLCLSAMAIDPCTTAATDCIDITIQKTPTAFAGTDQNICESENIELSEAVANNYSAVVWSGGAGSYDNPNAVNPTYTPAASEAGTTVTLCLSAMAIDPCTTATTDCIDITIQKTPTAFAGTDQNICESENIVLDEAEANNYSAVVWSGGAGSYDNPNAVNPTYTPAASEAGTTVTLCLSAMAIDPCTTAANDCIDITIQKAPTAFAGEDATICESDIFQISATATNYQTLQWITTGDGTFADATALATSYTPGADDAVLGEIKLVLQVQPMAPCSSSVIDDLILTVQACQSITIPAGWSGLSSWLQPEHPAIEALFGGAGQSVIVMQNLEELWWPAQNINTIHDWDVADGYMVKMAAPATIMLAGTAAQQTLQLSAGWNLIPVLSRCDVDVAALFADIDVEIVKEVAGSQLYWPAQNINTLGVLLTGKSYLVKMPGSATISFPACE